MQSLPFRSKVAACGMEQPADPQWRFAPVARNPGRHVRLFHAFVSRAAAFLDGCGMRIWGRIFGCSGAGKYVWSAISSGEVGKRGSQDAGQLLPAVMLRIAKDFNRRGRGEKPPSSQRKTG